MLEKIKTNVQESLSELNRLRETSSWKINETFHSNTVIMFGGDTNVHGVPDDKLQSSEPADHIDEESIH